MIDFIICVSVKSGVIALALGKPFYDCIEERSLIQIYVWKGDPWYMHNAYVQYAPANK